MLSVAAVTTDHHLHPIGRTMGATHDERDERDERDGREGSDGREDRES